MYTSPDSSRGQGEPQPIKFNNGIEANSKVQQIQDEMKLTEDFIANLKRNLKFGKGTMSRKEISGSLGVLKREMARLVKLQDELAGLDKNFIYSKDDLLEDNKNFLKKYAEAELMPEEDRK